MLAPLLAAALVPMVDINTTGIQSWVLAKIVPLIFLLLGLFILINARRGKMSAIMEIAAKALIGVCFLVGGALFIGLGDNLAHLFIK